MELDVTLTLKRFTKVQSIWHTNLQKQMFLISISNWFINLNVSLLTWPTESRIDIRNTFSGMISSAFNAANIWSPNGKTDSWGRLSKSTLDFLFNCCRSETSVGSRRSLKERLRFVALLKGEVLSVWKFDCVTCKSFVVFGWASWMVKKTGWRLYN